jgi:nucleoside-diphosphate-sugar epimerase
MKVLVSGANGFVGRSLCRYYQTQNHQLLAMVRAPAGFAQEIVVSDLDQLQTLHQQLSGYDSVIHLAARVHIMRDDSSDPLADFRKVNVEGTLNLARQAHLAGVRRFVYLSSIKVNGEQGRCVESDKPAPEDAYGVSKYEAEQALMALAQETGMEVVIIRPPLVYGSGVKGNFATLIRLVQKGWPLPLGAVHNKRSFIALDNLVSFIALCADREQSPAAANQTFLITDGEDVSTTELLHKVAKAYGKKLWLIPVPTSWMRLAAKLIGKESVADRLFGSLLADTSKARDLLAWRPVTTMDQQLRKMVSA